MAHLGLRANALCSRTAFASIADVCSTFERLSGPLGMRGSYRKMFPAAQQYLRELGTGSRKAVSAPSLWKLRQLGPVQAVHACGTQDATLVDINLEEEKIERRYPTTARVQVLY
jgi:hypothetical protein